MPFQVAKRATAETKPPNLYLHQAHSRTRAATPVAPDSEPGWHGGPYSQSQFAPQQPAPCCHPQHQHLMPPQPEQPTSSHPIEIPDVATWCRYLDAHAGWNNDGVVYTPYGPISKAKGFVRISQITTELFTVKDLAEWLDSLIGTAVFIMQYAKEDVASINAGKLIIPKLTDQ